MTKDNAIKIDVWVNEERLEKLKAAGLAEIAREKFAGMMVLEIACTEELKDALLRKYPSAKYDSSTTHSIELIPRDAKDGIFSTALRLRSTGPEVIGQFLQEKKD